MYGESKGLKQRHWNCLPTGRFYPDGHVELVKGAHIPGVSWITDEFQIFDNGLIIENYANDSMSRRTRGLVAFGTIDDRNVFRLLPTIDGKLMNWNTLRDYS